MTFRQLRTAYLALLEWAAASKPSVNEKGEMCKPCIEPLPAHLGFRLALCRNSLRAVVEPAEEELQKTTDLQERRKLLETETEWKAPTSINLQQLADRKIPEDWIAALIEVGILTESK